ncbi:30S ribosomal protein S1 [Isobaculum melis]|uniref:SSU ribosomal protein S1P n=1 Tax=Isobaculum melis TaxID=142588 RepID=A0A1H9R829_9LACT|nr:30S ribosomal protein S1 [Isobaculum melis]SER68876.1 SSU ribosomal protein S1P [Isobaculum melis]
MSEKETMQTGNEELLNALDSVQEVNVGDIVKAEVLAIEPGKEAIVGIEGSGVEGVVPFGELSTLPIEAITEVVNIGDVVELVVIKRSKDKENGSYMLSKKRIDAKKVWEEIQADFDAGTIIEAPVTDVVKGGLVVDAGVRGFVPASMVDVNFVDDFSVYKGKTMRFKIVEIEPSENRLILSHKAIAQEEREAAKKEKLATLLAGDIVTGKVARLTNFGAFVDLGGVDGLVHVSQISHNRVNKPEEVLAVGDEVTAKIQSVDPEAGRISLSIKDTLAGPWDNIEERAPKGATLKGTVKRLTSFGAFVEVFPGVEGLVHISQISYKHIATPHEVLSENAEVEVKVLEVKPEEKRLSLSIKALEEKPESMKQAEAEEHYELPEESTGFSFGEILGEALSSNEDAE